MDVFGCNYEDMDEDNLSSFLDSIMNLDKEQETVCIEPEENSGSLNLQSVLESLPDPGQGGDERNPQGHSKRRVKHVMNYYVNDIQAQTTNPNVMEKNFVFPMTFLYQEKMTGELCSLEHNDLKAEFVVSPEYIKSFGNKKLTALLDKLEKFRGVYVKSRHPRPVIKRSRHYAQIVKQYDSLKRVKTLDTLRQIQKTSTKKKHSIGMNSQPKLAKKDVKKSKSQELVDNNSGVVSDPGRTVLHADKVHHLTLGSVSYLKPGLYLNDEAMDFGLLKMFEMLPPQPATLFLPVHNWLTYFYSRKHELSVDRLYKKLFKMYPGLDFLKLKYMVIPVGQENHWLLAVVCRPFPDEKTVLALENEAKNKGTTLSACSTALYYRWLKNSRNPPKILIFDSMADYISRRLEFSISGYHDFIAENIKLGLLCLHQKLWIETKRDFIVDPPVYKKYITHHTALVPSQNNNEDCGIYTMRYLLMWCKEMVKLNDDYMSVYRTDFQKRYEKYEHLVTRKTLCEEILRMCEKKNSVAAPAVAKMIKEYFGPMSVLL